LIAYFDSSAVVPLFVDEPGSERAKAVWQDADRVYTARVTYPEARAALARASRLGRLDRAKLRTAVGELDDRFRGVGVVEVDDAIARRAGNLAENHALRGYDAVQLAAAERLRDEDLIVVAGDGAFLAAARDIGLMTAVVG
jgi:uncharacterized protein